MTEDNDFSDTNRIRNPYALSCLIFPGERKDYALIPEISGTYFLTNGHEFYIGCGQNLNVRIPASIGEQDRRGHNFSRYYFIVMPYLEKDILEKIETDFITAANTIIYNNNLEEKYGLLLLNSRKVAILPVCAWFEPYRQDYYYPVGAVQTVLRMIGIPMSDVRMGDVI